jgi:hypothetical protein
MLTVSQRCDGNVFSLREMDIYNLAKVDATSDSAADVRRYQFHLWDDRLHCPDRLGDAARIRASVSISNTTCSLIELFKTAHLSRAVWLPAFFVR